jgi:hypothetical protein
MLLTPDTPINIRRVLDDGRRAPATLPVAFADLELGSFHMAPGYLPGDPPRLAARIRHGAREWVAEGGEVVVIDPGSTSQALRSALGHLVAGHTCPDCAPAKAKEEAR